MDLRDYARIIRTRWRAILAPVLVALVLAGAYSFTATPVYQANTQLFVTTSNSGSDANNQYASSLFIQLRVKSYADIVTAPLVTQSVVDELDLPITASELGAKITADAPPETVLINVAVKDQDQALAVKLANAVSQRFTDVVASLETTSGALSSPVKLTITRPATSAGQVTPRTKLNLALGLLVGLAAGLGVGALREQLDSRVKGVRELQEKFDLNSLGVIPYDADTPSTPLTVSLPPHAPRAEAFRQLRTNLQFVDVDHSSKSLVVTSSLPSDGKSTTTCNLAIALAESGRKVLLIEGDLRRPKLGEYLGLTGAVGLSDVLIGRVDLEDAAQPWGTTGNLTVLLAGATPPNPAELLGSQQMSDLLRSCESEYFVVIDAPPLLPVTDAAVLSRVASGTVLVVRAGRTREDEVRQSLDNLDAVGATVYGAVINMAPVKGPDARRYGYGGYGYGYAPQGGSASTQALIVPTPLAETVEGQTSTDSPPESATSPAPSPSADQETRPTTAEDATVSLPSDQPAPFTASHGGTSAGPMSHGTAESGTRSSTDDSPTIEESPARTSWS